MFEIVFEVLEHLPYIEPGRVAQSVKCLATDASLTADPGVAVRAHYFGGDWS